MYVVLTPEDEVLGPFATRDQAVNVAIRYRDRLADELQIGHEASWWTDGDKIGLDDQVWRVKQCHDTCEGLQGRLDDIRNALWPRITGGDVTIDNCTEYAGKFIVRYTVKTSTNTNYRVAVLNPRDLRIEADVFAHITDD